MPYTVSVKCSCKNPSCSDRLTACPVDGGAILCVDIRSITGMRSEIFLHPNDVKKLRDALSKYLESFPASSMVNGPNHYCAESCGDDPRAPAESSRCPLRRIGECPEEKESEMSGLIKVCVKKLADDAMLPEFKSMCASGADVYSHEDGTLASHEVRAISTGIAVAIPPGYEIQVRSRSGLAAKSSVFVLNSPGTIDADYRGEVKVILANFGRNSFEFKKGDRIAQLICAPVQRVEYVPVPELGATQRGAGGLGSTGV